MTSVGERLRTERARQGIELAELARATHIQERYLEAIEAERVEDLPGAFFYRSFVRQYAQALHLDIEELEPELERVRASGADALQAALKQHAVPLNAVPPIRLDSSRTRSSGRVWGSVVLLAVVTFGCTVVYGWWRNQVEANPAPARSRTIATAPAVPAGAGPFRRIAPVQPAKIAQTAARPTLPAVETPAAPAATSSPDGHVVVSVAATDKVWISVSSDGKRLYAGLLEPSESKVLTTDTQFRMRIGNAGGLEVTWNGKPLGALGSRGQVRDVVFTTDKYRVLTPDDSL